MPTPKKGYYLADGTTKVPGVTTILSRFKESGALMWWAWDQGRQGLDYRATKQIAANAGTLAHNMVEAHLRGLTMPEVDDVDDEIIVQAQKGYENFLNFEKMTNLVITPLETPMVSERWGFGGTPDALLTLDGVPALGDWKTGGLYIDALMQMAAYQKLYEEVHPNEWLPGGFHLCRFNRDTADFTHHHFQDLNDAWEMFKLLLSAYQLDKVLKKRVS